MLTAQQHVNHVVPVNIRQPPEEPIVIFAVLANIRQQLEEQPIAIKVALPARTSVTPPLQPNTVNKAIVQFAVLVKIRSRTTTDPTNRRKRLAKPARTDGIWATKAEMFRNTMQKKIAKNAPRERTVLPARRFASDVLPANEPY